MNCLICNNNSLATIFSIYDDRYGYPGEFALNSCQKCGHISLDCGFTSAELTALYTNYYPRKNLDVNSYRPHLEKFGFPSWFNGLRSSAFRWVPKNVTVLDIGCGFGQSLGYHVVRGCDVYGVEADENINRVVNKFGFKVHVGLFDDKLYSANFFDYITMDQVIEHVTEPMQSLKGMARILKSGGYIILSTPNATGWGAKFFGKRWINWHAPYHLQFFSKDSMSLVAEQAGLELLKVKTITNSEWLYFQWMHLITYPKHNEPSSFWLPSKLQKSFLQRLGIGLLIITHKIKINHVLTRVFDSLNIGDNFVFILKKP